MQVQGETAIVTNSPLADLTLRALDVVSGSSVQLGLLLEGSFALAPSKPLFAKRSYPQILQRSLHRNLVQDYFLQILRGFLSQC